MSFVDDPHSEKVLDPLDKLQHAVKTPLTIIHVGAQLLVRTVRRAASFPDEVRTTMLAGLATIEGTVRMMVSLIDDMTRLPPDGPPALIAAGPLDDDERKV